MVCNIVCYISATMTSITCCSMCDEPANDLQTAYKFFANSVQGTAVKTKGTTRRKREFTPDEQKDDNYWLKRNRNNEAAKRSRQRKRMEEYLLETRAVELLRENEKLKAALSAVRYHGLSVNYPLGTIVGYPLAQELTGDAYLRSLVGFSGPVTQTPLSEANCVSYDALSGWCRSDSKTHNFSSAYDSVSFAGMTTAPNMSTINLMESVRERGGNIGRLGIPECNDGYSSTNTLMPVAYAGSKRKEVHSCDLSTMNLSQNRYSGPFSFGGTISNYSRLATTDPGCSTQILMDKHSTEDSAPIITDAKDISKEVRTIKQTERVCMRPLLPHKLRYKVNKAKHRENGLQITCSPRPESSDHV